MAVIAGVESAVQLHINRGDDLNACDSSGLTPLMLSATRNKATICQLLLDAGADGEMLDPSGKTAFDIAVAANAHEVIAVFTAAKVPTECFNALNKSPISDAFEAEITLATICSEPVVTLGNEISNEVFPSIPIAEKEDLLHLEEASEFDLQGWEPEENKPPPAADLSAVAAATAMQQAITEYVPIDSSADWDDVDAYLPETALPLARTGDDESRERLRLLLLRALREGSVPRREVEALTANYDRTANLEAEAVLSMVINDLGAEVDERFEYANARENCLVFVKPEETPDEEETLSDALACIESLAARRAEPLRIYQKEFQQHPLISAEQEVLLAQTMEGALEVALDTLAAWPHGIGLILDAGRLVQAGKRPLTWIVRSLSEASSDLDPALNSGSEESEDQDADDDAPSSANPSGGQPLSFAESLEQLSELPIGALPRDAGWIAVRTALSSLRLSRQFLLELADAKDDQNPDAVLQYTTTIKAYQRAREQMVCANLKLAFHMAKRYLYSGEPLEDLAQEANIGLLKGVDRFDWRRGFKFSTFATWWIRQQVGRYVADKCRTIRVPVHVHEKVQHLQRETEDFELETGCLPRIQEIAARMDMPSHKVAALQHLLLEPLSIHELSIDNLIAVEALDDFISPDPIDIVFKSELKAVIDKILASLGDQEEQILRLRYGVGVEDSLTLEKIGQLHGMTRERIRQIEAKIIQRLRRLDGIDYFINSVRKCNSPAKEQRNTQLTQEDKINISEVPSKNNNITTTHLKIESLPTEELISVDNLLLQAKELNIAIDDDRGGSSGKVWIKCFEMIDIQHYKLIRRLLFSGFKFSEGEGYWR